MNEKEIEVCMHQWVGMWPVPVEKPEELLALAGILDPYDRHEFENVVRDFRVMMPPRQLRPPPAELLTALQHNRHRLNERLASQRGMPEAPPAEDPLAWVAKAKETLQHTPLPPSKKRPPKTEDAPQ